MLSFVEVLRKRKGCSLNFKQFPDIGRGIDREHIRKLREFFNYGNHAKNQSNCLLNKQFNIVWDKCQMMASAKGLNSGPRV